jgi:hypothetical protein
MIAVCNFYEYYEADPTAEFCLRVLADQLLFLGRRDKRAEVMVGEGRRFAAVACVAVRGLGNRALLLPDS